jgi:transposase-like protein
MVVIEEKIVCPHCGSDNVSKHGTPNGKPNYYCNNPACSHKTFTSKYTYKGCDPKVRLKVLAMSADGCGTRAISRLEGVHRDTVTSLLKKRKIGQRT